VPDTVPNLGRLEARVSRYLRPTWE